MKICFPTSEHLAGNGYKDTEKLSLVGFPLSRFFMHILMKNQNNSEKTFFFLTIERGGNISVQIKGTFKQEHE